jgi:hypothetical protein
MVGAVAAEEFVLSGVTGNGIVAGIAEHHVVAVSAADAVVAEAAGDSVVAGFAFDGVIAGAAEARPRWPNWPSCAGGFVASKKLGVPSPGCSLRIWRKR